MLNHHNIDKMFSGPKNLQHIHHFVPFTDAEPFFELHNKQKQSKNLQLKFLKFFFLGLQGHSVNISLSRLLEASEAAEFPQRALQIVSNELNVLRRWKFHVTKAGLINM
jgi:hypothetical protein